MPAVNATTATVAARTTLPWRRGDNGVGIKHAAVPSRVRVPTRKAEDEASTTTGCSDAEDTASTMSRSSSGCDLARVISRDTMLFHRARCFAKIQDADLQAGLHCKSIAKSPPSPATKAPAPKAPTLAPGGFVPPPGLEMLNGAALATQEYSRPAFRKELMAILKDLAMDRNVGRAVRRVRSQGVPRERQAAEFADAITFIMEEARGAARRSFVALLAGLANGVFEGEQCIAGLNIFFDDIYPDLQDEIPKLGKLVYVELLPTLGSALPAEKLAPFLAKAKA